MDTNKFGTVEIKQSDVIRLILQYLQENHLVQSFKCLQKQSKVALNTIDKQTLSQMIINSHWPQLFNALNFLMPSQQNLFDLYELIVDDMIDQDCFTAASFVISTCFKGSNSELFAEYKQRILRLQYICENPAQKPLYQKPVTINRRQNLIARLTKETSQQPQKSRLVKLLGEAIKYQSLSGLIKPNISMSLFENKQHELSLETEQLIKAQDKLLKYSEESRITAIKISNKGEYIALGGIDGLIQIYNPLDYTLHNGLAFQAEDVMLYHDDPITHLHFNDTDEMLLSADIKGNVKIWNLGTGKLLRKLQYETTIGSVSWGNDPSQILMGYHNIKLYGIRGCNILKEYICGGGAVNTNDNEFIMDIFCSTLKIYSITQNGTIRIHNYRTQEQINYLTHKNTVIIKTVPNCNNSGELSSFLICNQNRIIEYDGQLSQITKFSLSEDSTSQSKYANFACVSNYIYECVENTLDNGKITNYKLQVREKKTGKIIYFCALQNKLTIMELQKYRNLLITYNEEDSLEFWRP